MDKNLEFRIKDKWLDVIDFVWDVNSINMLYIAHSCLEKGKYAIRIVTDNEVDELYFRTGDELKISSEFKKLCSALGEVNSNFKVYFPKCFNFSNVKDVRVNKKGIFNETRITFNSGDYLDVKATGKKVKLMIADMQDAKLQDFKL